MTQRRQPYDIRTDILHGPLEKMEVGKLVDETTVRWFNQSLCIVNESVLRVGILEGEFHWHRHDEEDELFFVLEGNLLLDLEGETVELGPRDGYVVPKGLDHRTRARERTVVLMLEKAGVDPEGDA